MGLGGGGLNGLVGVVEEMELVGVEVVFGGEGDGRG